MNTPSKILIPFLSKNYLRVSQAGIMNDYHDIIGKYSDVAKLFFEKFEKYEILECAYNEKNDFDAEYYFFVINAMDFEKFIIVVPKQPVYSATYCETLASQCGFDLSALAQAVTDNR